MVDWRTRCNSRFAWITRVAISGQLLVMKTHFSKRIHRSQTEGIGAREQQERNYERNWRIKFFMGLDGPSSCSNRRRGSARFGATWGLARRGESPSDCRKKEKRSTYTSYAEMMSSILTEIGPRNGQVSTMCAIAYLSTSRGVPRKRAQNK